MISLLLRKKFGLRQTKKILVVNEWYRLTRRQNEIETFKCRSNRRELKRECYNSRSIIVEIVRFQRRVDQTWGISGWTSERNDYNTTFQKDSVYFYTLHHKCVTTVDMSIYDRSQIDQLWNGEIILITSVGKVSK